MEGSIYVTKNVKEMPSWVSTNFPNKHLDFNWHHDPSEGDFSELVKDDFENAGVPFDLNFIESSTKEAYRGIVKKKIRECALKYLQNKQQTHSKVKDIVYEKLETQQFLKSPLFTNENNSYCLLWELRLPAHLKQILTICMEGKLSVR